MKNFFLLTLKQESASMLFSFQNIPIIFNKEILVNDNISVRISNQTVLVFVDGNNLFSFYPKELSYDDLWCILQETFLEYEVTISELELKSILSQIGLFYLGENHVKL